MTRASSIPVRNEVCPFLTDSPAERVVSVRSIPVANEIESIQAKWSEFMPQRNNGVSVRIKELGES